ncbi:MAG: TonB-dependent receptor [Mucilaginibacter sp.]|uniref:TonB-dependent receptor n=1 Tax=Mucilaginibacter sp. TaxID=1882438 RepID=UPI003267A8D5
MKKLLLAITGLVLPFWAAAQFSVSGKITDQRTGETLPGATISIDNTYLNAVADAKGSYLIKNIRSGSYTIKVSYVGYQLAHVSINLTANSTQNFALNKSTQVTDEVTVKSTRASNNAATAFTNLNKKDLEKNNLGQDLPFLLNQTPSVVVTSDAGAGVGYTGIRIRGSDATRTNLTLNGIPLNDAEDQGAYFIDLPDLVSSVDNIQIQRGIGTSTNGAGAFGASINMQTTTRRDTGYAELNNTFGSYNTLKNTVSIGSGLIDGKFSFDGRLSRIKSDGYINRASSDLKSYFLSAAYYGKNTLIRANVFSGYEKTYQAWNGVEQTMLAKNRQYNELGLESNGTFYNNETDNYTQNYAQLLVTQKLSDVLSFNGALHYTRGFGYYEEYKNADPDYNPVTSYGLDPAVVGVTTTDLVRRLWLDNDFYGLTYNFNYTPKNNLNFVLGGAYNEYKGRHYNNIQWSQDNLHIGPDYEYSRNNAKKTDFNIFAKADIKINQFTLLADLQYRHLNYSFLGFDRNLNNVQQEAKLDFFNPKAGITYQINTNNNVYASFAIANHEPNRNDYTNSTPDSRPKPENMKDLEIGYRANYSGFNFGINGFFMDYKDQLILTGQINDVGEYIRSNVADSYRLGVELDSKLRIIPQLYWAATLSLSANKVKNFNEFVDNYDTGGQDENKFTTTDIAFSPSVVASSEFSFAPVKGGEIALISKYVGKQYLDNTSNNTRKIDGFFVNSARLRYGFSTKSVKNIGVSLLVNNLFSTLYSANGYTYAYIESAKRIDTNYYYPQATRNFLLSLSLAF